MFIVTMVFLTGLIFAVHQVLLQYSAIDPSTSMQATDTFLIKSIHDTYEGTIAAHTDCQDAEDAVREVHGFILKEETRGFVIEMKYNGRDEPNLRCENWNTTRPVLTLGLNVVSSTTETDASFEFNRKL